MDALSSSSELCTWFDAGEVLEYGRTLTKDEVLACGESPTVLKVLDFKLMAKVGRDVSESGPPISKGFPMIKRSLRIWGRRTDNECSPVMVPLRVDNLSTEHTCR